MYLSDDLACHELVELVTDYLEDALAPLERARLERHLDQCAGCREYLAQMRQTIQALGRVQVDSIQPAMRTGCCRSSRMAAQPVTDMQDQQCSPPTRILTISGSVSNHFRPRRHRLTASTYRQFRTKHRPPGWTSLRPEYVTEPHPFGQDRALQRVQTR